MHRAIGGILDHSGANYLVAQQSGWAASDRHTVGIRGQNAKTKEQRTAYSKPLTGGWVVGGSPMEP